MRRLFGRPDTHGVDAEPATATPTPTAPVAPPSPFGAFGENGEKVGEHITYFLSRLDDVYSLRQQFAAVAEPMQKFVRSHDEAQTRLAEANALLSRERADGQALRAEHVALRAAHHKLESSLAEVTNQSGLHEKAAEDRGSRLRALQITHDDVAAKLDWATRQLAIEAQNADSQADIHRTLNEDLGKRDQDLAFERARYAELKDLHEGAAAEAKRLNGQVERLQPDLAAARRRIGELESEIGNARATTGALDLKIAAEQEARRATDTARAQEKAGFDAELAALTLQIEALESRHQVTTKLFEQTRGLLNEKIEEARLAERAAKEAAIDKAAAERRHAVAQDEIRRLTDQTAQLGARHGEAQERCTMLTNALAAKDAHVEQLQSRADAIKAQLDEAVTRHEHERSTIEGTNRKLIEEVQSERAERALAQGALTIARGSREKLLTQIEELKRDRFGRAHDGAADARDGNGSDTNITPFRTPDLATSET